MFIQKLFEMSDYYTLQTLKMAPNQRMCNELIRELSKEIPTVNTSDRILLTSYKMYAYLAPIFSKKLIYRDAITFLKAMMKAKKNIEILINRVAQNKENEPIVVVSQEQWDHEGKTNFELETNKFCVQIRTGHYYRAEILIIATDDQFENDHLLFFLRLIAPVIQPIQLDFYPSIPIASLVRFSDTQRDWIDCIRLWAHQFNSEPIYEALSKYNKLQIYEPISPANVPKLIHWLTSNNHNNGQSKKYNIFLSNFILDDGLALLIDGLKKEFLHATSKSRFVVRVELRQELDEFTMCNELTGERLQLRRKNTKNGLTSYELSCSPNSEFDSDEDNCTGFDPTRIYFALTRRLQ